MSKMAALGFFGTIGASHAFVAAPQVQTVAHHSRAALVTSGPMAQSSFSTVAAAGVATSVVAIGAAAMRRGALTARRAAKKKDAGPSGEEIAKTIVRPEDLVDSPKFPLFGGSTGGYMSKTTKERHAITWTSKEALDFEMPTGGWAIMNAGENLCYFRKKEQCIALGKQLRKMKIENYKVFRISKDGEVTFMHPADGVFPEKVNKGRIQVNGRPFTVNQNPQPGLLKWTKYHMKSYEADPLSVMFVKARMRAYEDSENVFPLPQPRDLDNDSLLPKGYESEIKQFWSSL